MDEALSELISNHDGYLSDKWEQYVAIYEREFSRFRAPSRPVSILEIGVQNGGSLQIWSRYLPAGSHVVGLDVDEACASLSLPENVEVLIGDASDPHTQQRLLGDRTFDVIIDDGSHRSAEVIAAFETLFDRLNDGGLYFAEDLHCSYLAEYGGGYRSPGSAVEWFKGLVEALNFDHLKDAPPAAGEEFHRLRRLNRSIARLTFYDSVAVIEKNAFPKDAPYLRIMTGGQTPVADPAPAIWEMAPRQIRDLRLSASAASAFSPSLTESVAKAKAEMVGLRQDVADERARSAALEPRVRAMDEKLREAEAERAEGAARVAALQDRLAAEQARLGELDTLRRALGRARSDAATLSDAHNRVSVALAAANDELATARHERDLIAYSTLWRATRPVRTALGAIPGEARQRFVRGVRLLYWTLTLQLPRRLRQEGQPPAPAAQPQAAGAHAGIAGIAQDPSYGHWIKLHDTLSDADRRAIREHIAAFAGKPLISVVMPVYNTAPDLLKAALASVRNQIYPHWELCIADDASPSSHVGEILAREAALDSRVKWMRRETNGHISLATNSALTLAAGTFVAFMDHDDILSERALYEVAAEIDAYPEADMLYSDQDLLDENGRRHTPYFKTDWNPDLMFGHNIVSHLGVYRRSLLERIGGLRQGFEGSQDYDLTLRFAAVTRPERIRHIPAILYHWREVIGGPSVSQTELDRCVEAARSSIEEHLRATGRPGAEVGRAPDANWWTRVRWPLPGPAPRVSVVIPTRDRAELLDRCTGGLLRRTDYPDLEVVVVDNDTQDPDALAVLRRLAGDRRVRIEPAPGPFNFSALVNAGVKAASGGVIVLLNNDIDVIDPGWLRELVSQAVRPEVGAVGARLLYEDGRLQHAGIVLGVGNPSGDVGVADNLGVGALRNDIGYMGFYALARQVSAVTGACMALRRDVFDAVGGMNAENLAVAYNDVDICLRIREAGLAVVWTPFAELFHLESASRGSDLTAEQAGRFEAEWNYMRGRWGPVLDADPFLNPNLSWDRNTFQLGYPPRREKPWVRHLAADAAPAAAEPGPAAAPRYVDWPPAVENAGRAFEGEWSSAVPGLPSGKAGLFDDGRIKWFEERLGGFAGRRVLELGPLEGGHTHMMTKRGAQVLAIESNRGAWIRCVVAKDALCMSGATFLLGDFRKYLEARPEHFDFVLASGVLYHMTDPVQMLENLAEIGQSIGLWTHYFDEDGLKRRPGIRDKFDYKPRIATTRHGRQVPLYDQSYREALDWAGFCGGAASASVWMSRQGIIGVLEDEGFVVETGVEQADHPHGPAFCVFARKRPAIAG